MSATGSRSAGPMLSLGVQAGMQVICCSGVFKAGMVIAAGVACCVGTAPCSRTYGCSTNVVTQFSNACLSMLDLAATGTLSL